MILCQPHVVVLTLPIAGRFFLRYTGSVNIRIAPRSLIVLRPGTADQILLIAPTVSHVSMLAPAVSHDTSLSWGLSCHFSLLIVLHALVRRILSSCHWSMSCTDLTSLDLTRLTSRAARPAPRPATPGAAKTGSVPFLCPATRPLSLSV